MVTGLSTIIWSPPHGTLILVRDSKQTTAYNSRQNERNARTDKKQGAGGRNISFSGEVGEQIIEKKAELSRTSRVWLQENRKKGHCKVRGWPGQRLGGVSKCGGAGGIFQPGVAGK